LPTGRKRYRCQNFQLQPQIRAAEIGARLAPRARLGLGRRSAESPDMRVLVTEDEADVQGVIARALERDGHAVSTASSLDESRRALSSGVDLLVLDLSLPDGSGLTLCREI